MYKDYIIHTHSYYTRITYIVSYCMGIKWCLLCSGQPRRSSCVTVFAINLALHVRHPTLERMSRSTYYYQVWVENIRYQSCTDKQWSIRKRRRRRRRRRIDPQSCLQVWRKGVAGTGRLQFVVEKIREREREVRKRPGRLINWTET